jgi:cell division septation protein DedD
VIEDDGKILVTGAFTNYNGNPRRQVARLNNDGSIDNTFNPGSGFASISGLTTVDTVAKYNDKYFLTGEFNSYSGISANGLIRLNYDGTKDDTFNYGSGLSFASSSFSLGYILDSGIHLVVGEINGYNGFQLNDVVYLNPFGTLLNCPFPTPTPTPTNTTTPTNTPTNTTTPTNTPTNTTTPTNTPTNTTTPTNTLTNTPTETPTRTPTPTNNRFGFAVYTGLTSDDACSQVNIPATIYGNESLFDENNQFYNDFVGPVTIDMTGFYNYDQVVVELFANGAINGSFSLCVTPTPTNTPTNTPTPTPTVTPT